MTVCEQPFVGIVGRRLRSSRSKDVFPQDVRHAVVCGATLACVNGEKPIRKNLGLRTPGTMRNVSPILSTVNRSVRMRLGVFMASSRRSSSDLLMRRMVDVQSVIANRAGIDRMVHVYISTTAMSEASFGGYSAGIATR